MISVADALRALCAAEALALVVVCIYCAASRVPVDQRVRFSALALIGVVVVSGQIDAWGRPATWRMPVLAVALALAVVGSVMFLVKGRRRDRSESRNPGT